MSPCSAICWRLKEVSQALDHLSANTNAFGFDASCLYVGGWSAGGHLTAMMLGHTHAKGGLAISGIFELESIALIYLNEPLSLSQDEIANLSPIRLIDPGLAPVRVVVGGDETSKLRRQSEEYSTAANAAGMTASLRMAQGRNHYSMLEELRDPDGGLTQDLLRLISAT